MEVAARSRSNYIAAIASLILVLASVGAAQGYTLNVLYTFKGPRKGDGGGPYGRLIMDDKGNLYGAAEGGDGCGEKGCGIIYELAPGGAETVLHDFSSSSRDLGLYPSSGLIANKSREFAVLYGTTAYGGLVHGRGEGTIYSFTLANGAETVLHSFDGYNDGRNPTNDLVKDKSGNLYGTTFYGGELSCGILSCGIVYKVTPTGSETILYRFQGGNDGENPNAALIIDKNGNLYGTTALGGGGTQCSGEPPAGCGTVFKVSPDGVETLLYAFSGGSDGAGPSTRLSTDDAGNLYGATTGGGAYGSGVIFEVVPDGTETVLYSFQGGSDGVDPAGDLIFDHAGNLYGTTLFGGGTGCSDSGCGIVYTLNPKHHETILHAFTGGDDGKIPYGLMQDKAGNLYGVAEGGGKGFGTVYELIK